MLNPILTRGVNLTPLYEICDCLATAADRDTPFHQLFFQVLCIFWYQVHENWTNGREVTWHFVLTCRHKLCPKSAFCICLCTKHMEITDFLKMHYNSVYSIFRAICTISYILKLIKIGLHTSSAFRKKVLNALRRAKRSFEIIKVKGFFLNFSPVISENGDCDRFQIKTWICLWIQNENCQK